MMLTFIEKYGKFSKIAKIMKLDINDPQQLSITKAFIVSIAREVDRDPDGSFAEQISKHTGWSVNKIVASRTEFGGGSLLEPFAELIVPEQGQNAEALAKQFVPARLMRVVRLHDNTNRPIRKTK